MFMAVSGVGPSGRCRLEALEHRCFHDQCLLLLGDSSRRIALVIPPVMALGVLMAIGRTLRCVSIVAARGD